MKLDIELNGIEFVGTELCEILLPETHLELAFSSSIYRLDTILITAKNGEKTVKKKLIAPHMVDISELLCVGTIETEISLISKNEAVKTWRLQDIIVKEINHQFKLVPEIEQLKGSIKEIAEILKRNNLR